MKALQTKNISFKDALLVVVILSSFRRQRNDQTFDRFYEDVVTQTREITIAPELPRMRKKKFPDEVIRT